MNTDRRDLYGVIGNPVAHSKSPAIHAAFSLQTGHALRYERVYAPLDDFIGTVRVFEDEGGLGLNVTLPFKLEAYAYAQTRTERARRAGAVNTLRFDAGKRYGDNTDGIGLVRDLARLGSAGAKSWEGARILILGAGGAARGILGPLLDLHPEIVVLANRTEAAARTLAGLFGAGASPVLPVSTSDLQGRTFELVINATSAGLDGLPPEVPGTLLREARLVYDLGYTGASDSDMTPFLCLAREHGAAATADGLGMLVEQAAESFFIWRGVRPDTVPVLAALRASI